MYAALVYEIGNDIEEHRLPCSTDVNQTVASYRFSPAKEGQLFNPDIGYDWFQTRSRELANLSKYSHVVLTDIADFYPRLYHHRVEGAMSNATKKNNHVLALIGLISQWNQTQSYGIPVGPAPSRLIAEISIDDVDKILMAERIDFVRFVDDYRLFATSEVDGYRKLAQLANALFKNHGLTLQQEKTSIQPTENFLDAVARTPQSQELDELSRTFSRLLEDIGIDDPYGDIEYDDLNPTAQEIIDSLNLDNLLAEQVNRHEIDQPTVRFLLARFGQLDDVDSVENVIQHLETFFPVFPQVIRYLGRLRS